MVCDPILPRDRRRIPSAETQRQPEQFRSCLDHLNWHLLFKNDLSDLLYVIYGMQFLQRSRLGLQCVRSAACQSSQTNTANRTGTLSKWIQGCPSVHIATKNGDRRGWLISPMRPVVVSLSSKSQLNWSTRYSSLRSNSARWDLIFYLSASWSLPSLDMPTHRLEWTYRGYRGVP